MHVTAKKRSLGGHGVEFCAVLNVQTILCFWRVTSNKLSETTSVNGKAKLTFLILEIKKSETGARIVKRFEKTFVYFRTKKFFCVDELNKNLRRKCHV